MNKNNKPTIVFFYLELADYFLSCAEELNNSRELSIHIFHKKVNPEAPFDFGKFERQIEFTDVDTLSDAELQSQIEELGPKLIFCGGWVEKRYLSAVSKYKEKTIAVLAFDTAYDGSLRQNIMAWLFKLFYKRHFDHVWVTGHEQKKLAEKMGFKTVHLDVYSANVPHFESIYHEILPSKEEAFPRRFIYMGRYLRHKGIFDMWDAFIQAKTELDDTKWELV